MQELFFGIRSGQRGHECGSKWEASCRKKQCRCLIMPESTFLHITCLILALLSNLNEGILLKWRHKTTMIERILQESPEDHTYSFDQVDGNFSVQWNGIMRIQLNCCLEVLGYVCEALDSKWDGTIRWLLLNSRIFTIIYPNCELPIFNSMSFDCARDNAHRRRHQEQGVIPGSNPLKFFLVDWRNQRMSRYPVDHSQTNKSDWFTRICRRGTIHLIPLLAIFAGCSTFWLLSFWNA